MITYFKKTIKDTFVIRQDQADKGVWVSVVSPTTTEVDLVARECDVPIEFIKACLDKEEVARVETESGVISLIFKVPYFEEENVLTVPFGVIITKDKILTVCLKDHPLINEFVQNGIKGFLTTDKTKFLLQITNKINAYFLNYLSHVEKRAEEIERKLHKAVENKEIISLLGLQGTLLYFNKATAANNAIIERLLKGSVIRLNDSERDALEDISFDARQAIETVGIYSGILSSTVEAYASIVSNNLNIVMKFLAAITIIISVPVVVASFFGMNVRLPLADHPAAFIMILFISITLVLTTGFIFSRKNFL